MKQMERTAIVLDGWSQSLAIGHLDAFPTDFAVHLFAEFASKID